MAKRDLPSPDILRQLLRYEPDTGKLFWLPRSQGMFPTLPEWKRWNARYAGVEAFATLQSNGYRIGHIQGRKYYAHRVIWALAHGRWPTSQIDHVNCVMDDNRLTNLREASGAQNQRNKGRMANNTSGFKGVSWNARDKKWQALIATEGRNRHVGYFDTPEEAHAAYCAAAKQMHGEFARLT
jgi:hypothetical protein